MTSPTTVNKPKRPRNASSTQRKPSGLANAAVASTASKRRARAKLPKKEEGKEEEEQEQSEDGEEAEDTESVAESASVADTDGMLAKGLRASSRRKGGQDEAKSETSTSGRVTGGPNRVSRVRARGRTRVRGRGH